MSAQQLSDATTLLGCCVPRTVITNLENGRRDAIDVTELLVIAAALNVPPVLFIAPIGYRESVQILPNVDESPWRARGWFLGAVPLATACYDRECFLDARTAIEAYDDHASLIREHANLRDTVQKRLRARRAYMTDERRDVDSADLNRLDVMANEMARSLAHIIAHRKMMEGKGLVLPPLPADLLEDILWGPTRSAALED
jgi:hypothetical protein